MGDEFPDEGGGIGGDARPIPVTILTGFLGSGKTSVLNHVLRHPEFAGTAVIVNEFGAIGIDHLLIESAIEDAVLLKNGCLCCTIRGDLADALAELEDRRDRGELPPFRRVVIETTGLADPAPLAALIAALDSSRWHLGAIVATADATLVAGQMATQPEVGQQLALADAILLTKRDLVDERQAHAAEEAVRRINAVAPLHQVRHGAARAADVMPPPRALAAMPAPNTLRPHGHVDLRYRHHAAIRSAVVGADAPLNAAGLAAWLAALLSLRGADVLRLKGIAVIAGADRPLLVQAVEHVVHPPVWLDIPLAEFGTTRIVVIGRNLSSQGLQSSFDACQREASPAIDG